MQTVKTRQGRSISLQPAASRASGASAGAKVATTTQRPSAARRLHAVKPASEANDAAAGAVAGLENQYGAGRAQRLTKAFQALEGFPALAGSRERLDALLAEDQLATGEIVAAIESDVALTLRTLCAANEARADRDRPVETVAAATELLGRGALRSLAAEMQTFDFFEHPGVWDTTPDRFRLHALATARAADMVASEIGYEQRDRLSAVSMLHDVGKLVLMNAYPGYPRLVHQGAGTPEQRLHQERRELGVDHTLMGGVFARRWGLPNTTASSIERHHNPEPETEAALVRLGDLLAHYEQGALMLPVAMLGAARAVGLGAARLRSIMGELPSATSVRRRHTDPCPLSSREVDVLQRLAEGKVYKQIAHELLLSTSTVRTHLHNIYGKLGAVDRAQAVLIAAERGWL